MYRDIVIDGTAHRADLGILPDHRITIKDGDVSVSPDLDGRTPGAEFEAAFTGRGKIDVIAAPEECVIGDAVLEPGDDLKMARAAKLAEIAAARWREEVGGTAVNGMAIDTSRESQALVTGATPQATIDPEYTCRWKTAAGFVELDAAAILAVAVAVRTHVQACFDKEANLAGLVNEA
ncbi:MAG: DUF4376 domain-containing protein, partial [Synergistaceae bacterium]|nr:DUF4376 domain-containing protein [Synergistaceae bacterium]